MKTLINAFIAACSLSLVAPALANEYEGRAEEQTAEERRSSSRGNKKKAKRGSSSRQRADGNHGDGHRTSSRSHSSSRHHVTHHTSRRHDSHAVHSRSSHRRHRHGVVVHHRSSRARVVVASPRPTVVVHPSEPAMDRRSETVEVRRRADKARRFSIGGGVGVASSRMFNHEPYSNLGVEGQARYRIADPLGLEASLGYYGDLDPDLKRVDVPFTTSVMLHTPGAFPLGAHLLAGVSLVYRDYDLTCLGGEHLRGGLVGGHVGAGLNVNLGPDATLEWDVRYTHYFNDTGMKDGGAGRNNVSSNLSVNYYF